MNTIAKAALVAVLLSLSLVAAAPPQAAQAQEGPQVEYWAVLVGISDYQVIGDLQWTAHGARELRQRLAAAWGEEHVKLLIDEEATKAGIEAALREWLGPREDADDVVLFFFSGHGDHSCDTSPIDEEDGRDEYLCPWDAAVNSSARGIRDDELALWLDPLDSENICVIIDTCYAGGIVDDVAGDGRVCLASSAESEPSWEDGTLEHSVFCNFLLQALGSRADVDANGDWEVSAEEAFGYIEPRVVDFRPAQHPQVRDGYGGELELLMFTTFDTGGQPVSISVDGTMYSSQELPVSFVWQPGSAHTSEVVSWVHQGEGTRYVFAGWSDGDLDLSRAISRGGQYTALYTHQYYLAVESEFGDPDGEGWYLAGATAAVSASSPIGTIVRKVFTGWSGDVTAATTTAAVTMDGPKTVRAGWRDDYLNLYLLAGGLAVIAVEAWLLVVAIRRRRARL